MFHYIKGTHRWRVKVDEIYVANGDADYVLESINGHWTSLLNDLTHFFPQCYSLTVDTIDTLLSYSSKLQDLLSEKSTYVKEKLKKHNTNKNIKPSTKLVAQHMQQLSSIERSIHSLKASSLKLIHISLDSGSSTSLYIENLNKMIFLSTKQTKCIRLDQVP